MRPQPLIIAAAFFILIFWTAAPQAAEDSQAPVSFSWELKTLELGNSTSDLLLVIWIIPDEGWYTYAHDPGEMGQPTVLTPRSPSVPGILQAYYPPGKDKPDPLNPGAMVSAYEGKTPVFIPLLNGLGDELALDVDIRMLLCTETRCLPFHTTLDIDTALPLPGSEPSAADQEWWNVFLASLSTQSDLPPALQALAEAAPTEIPDLEPEYLVPGLEVRGLGKAILLAVLAGFILNFMPCVLPVISMKIRGLLSHQDEDEHLKLRKFRIHNIFFSLGILSFFIILSFLAAFIGLAWGQLFQNTLALQILILIVFVFGLSLLGVFNLPILGGRALNKATFTSVSTEGYATGFLATLLATPCSGPFLGGVLAWSLFQPPLIIAIVFCSIGLGMASPYLFFCLLRQPHRFLPKPGNWMVIMEQFFGFLLLATCIYLLSLLPDDRVMGTLVLAWLAGLSVMFCCKWPMRRAFRLVVLGSLLAGIVLFHTGLPGGDEQEPVAWEPFTKTEFLSVLGKQPLVLEFTADWCPTCKVLERTVLNDKNMSRWISTYGFTPVKVDITHENPEAMALLRELGSQSIPLVAMFPAAGETSSPLVLRDLFTTGQMENALEQTFGTSP
ncbi:MAG: cytochrome c biogenesis protein CcdA [Desulfovibrionales bacterium]